MQKYHTILVRKEQQFLQKIEGLPQPGLCRHQLLQHFACLSL
jgi:hypothetical protein